MVSLDKCNRSCNAGDDLYKKYVFQVKQKV